MRAFAAQVKLGTGISFQMLSDHLRSSLDGDAPAASHAHCVFFKTSSTSPVFIGDYPDHAKRFLAECYRLLEPGGLISVRLPDTRWSLEEYTGLGNGKYFETAGKT